MPDVPPEVNPADLRPLNLPPLFPPLPPLDPDDVDVELDLPPAAGVMPVVAPDVPAIRSWPDFVNELARIGRELITTPPDEAGFFTLSEQAIATCTSPIFKPGWLTDELGKAMRRVLEHLDLEHYFATANNLAGQWQGSGPIDVAALYGLRVLLESARDMAFSFGDGTGHSTSFAVGGSAGDASQGKGGGASNSLSVGAGRDRGTRYGVGMSIKMVLVHCLALVDRAIEYATADGAPGPGEASEAYARGLISRKDWELYLRYEGEKPDLHYTLLPTRYERLSPRELLQAARRFGWDDATLTRKLQQRGLADPEDQQTAKKLYDEIPPVTDLLHFVQRNVTDPEVVDKLGLDREFDRFWQGPIRDALTQQGIPIEWAKLYWRVHWQVATIGQAYEAFRRLRPGRVDPSLVFDRDKLEQVFRENDVLPFWRDRFVALAYQPPGIRFIREMYATRTINDQELQDKLQDIGYSPADALLLQQSMTKVRARNDASTGHGFTVQEIAALYKSHGMTEANVRDYLSGLFYTDQQADQLIARVTAEWAAEARGARVKALHAGYLHGVMSRAFVSDQLGGDDFPAAQVADLLRTWDLERQAALHAIPPAELVSWYKAGLVPLTTLQDRLLAYGFSPTDVTNVVAIANGQIVAAQLHAIDAAAHKAAAAAAAAAAAGDRALRRAHAVAAAKARIVAGEGVATVQAGLAAALAEIDAETVEEVQAASDAAGKAKVKAAAFRKKGAARKSATLAAESAKIPGQVASIPLP